MQIAGFIFSFVQAALDKTWLMSEKSIYIFIEQDKRLLVVSGVGFKGDNNNEIHDLNPGWSIARHAIQCVRLRTFSKPSGSG